ncbi:SseB family protein [Nioella nitratireducens]|uniref:SseB family protein n=1 Tax=Nioella nitratireducens TaxID=1287720 RepID=UPI0008FCE759|nr:SseB family protein [Nioella nitratireducens]
MTETTPLDAAHAAMEATPEDDAARLRFYERLADCELFLALEGEPGEDEIAPRIFPVDGAQFVLVFDREERLAAFAEGVAPYAVVSGRGLAAMLAGQGIGLAVNPGAASSILIPAEAIDWLAATLAEAPREVEETPEEISAPAGLPEILIRALDTKLATAAGRALSAYLVGVTYRGGRRSHMLAFVDPVPGAESALARAAGEALTFSGIEAGVIDVGFFRASDQVCATLAKAGLRFDLPQPKARARVPGSAPGMDPDSPPKLR